MWRIKLNESGFRAFSGLLPYLDGSHTVDQILDQVEEQGIERPVARAVLDHLENSTLIDDAATVSSLPAEELKRLAPQLSFFSRFTNDGGLSFQETVGAARIALLGDGELAASTLRGLERAGIGEVVHLDASASEAESSADTPSGTRVHRLPRPRHTIWPDGATAADGQPIEAPELFVVTLESHDPELLEAMDEHAREHGTQWLLLKLFDRHLGWVGPLFVPGETASYASMEARFRSNIPFYDQYTAFDSHLRAQGDPAPPIGALLAFIDLLSNIAITEIVRFLTGIDTPRLAGRFLTIDLLKWDFEMHEVLRMPRTERGSASTPTPFPWKEIPYASDEHRPS